MIDRLHRLIKEKQEELSRDSLVHSTLNVDSFMEWVRVKGKYEGLQMALDTIEELMGGKVDSDA